MIWTCRRKIREAAPIRASHYKTRAGASVTEMSDVLRRAASDAFGGDRDKVALWLHSSNPRLAGASPAEVAINRGGFDAAIAALSPVKRTRGKAGGLI